MLGLHPDKMVVLRWVLKNNDDFKQSRFQRTQKTRIQAREIYASRVQTEHTSLPLPR